ncbi:PDR/VanB family oxidoreductase [Williamsia muralis]|uniref:Oxidoreductase n=1 Tax=Williamsia marianensis TaxID=85044 RepID=A0A2G3PK28_WILMA|nr:PDR/VanB family oxidoreductase [Williamsia marianensis]PHV66177.1 oxidoreductase [Williamsia marianensis]
MNNTGSITRHAVRVADRLEITPDVVMLRLEPTESAALPAWDAGAHIELHLPSGLSRHYSLCSDPRDTSQYTVCVLREEQGRGGSLEIHRDVSVGTKLITKAPKNLFPLIEDAKSYLFIAGGIGITPIKAMIEAVARRGQDWRLIYGGRSLSSMAFADELKAEYGDLVTLVPLDSAGLIDVSRAVASVGEGSHLYCCGPTGLLNAVTAECESAGIGPALHIERFTAPDDKREEVENDPAGFDVELRESGVTVHVGADESILDAVMTVREDIDSSCHEGYCGSCESRVLEGVPEHRGSLMTPEEHDEEGTMLICVGRSKTPKLVLDL